MIRTSPLRLVCHVIVALLRYHVRFQVSDCTWLSKARLTRGLSWSCCRSSLVGLESLLRATHGLPPWRHWCTVGVLAGTHQCATEWQSANPFLCLSSCPHVVVFHAHLQLRILALLLGCGAIQALSRHHSLSFQIEFTPKLWVFSPMKSLIGMFFVSFEISSHFSCLLLAKSQSILFT